MKKKDEGCVSAAAGVIGSQETEPETQKAPQPERGRVMTARVGQAAPDFEATAYHQNEFRNVKLSDHKGKWIVLCFYPGDFTFV